MILDVALTWRLLTYDALGTVHSLSADTWPRGWDLQNSPRSSFPNGFMLEDVLKDSNN